MTREEVSQCLCRDALRTNTIDHELKVRHDADSLPMAREAVLLALLDTHTRRSRA